MSHYTVTKSISCLYDADIEAESVEEALDKAMNASEVTIQYDDMSIVDGSDVIYCIVDENGHIVWPEWAKI